MHLRIAAEPDVELIGSLLHAPHVIDFVSGATDDEIRASIEDPNEEYLLAVEDHQRRVLGLGLLSGLRSSHRSVELRKVLVTTSGLGHGTTLLQLLMGRSFDDHSAHRIWLDVFPHNAVARRLYEKSGFVEEGTHRDAYLYHGEFRSVIICSMLEAEFRQRCVS